MCLTVSKKLTQNLINKHKTQKKFKVYKRVKRYDPKFYCISDSGTEIRSIAYSKHIWKAGINKSDANLKELSKKKLLQGKSVYNGIHVYLSKDIAKKVNKVRCTPFYKIIELTVDINDLIACDVDRRTAVFTKVHLSAASLRSALGGD